MKFIKTVGSRWEPSVGSSSFFGSLEAPPPPGVRARLNTAAGCGSTTLHCIGSYYGLPWCGCHQWYVFHGHNRFLDLINRVHNDNHLYFFTRYRASYVKNAATVEISDCRMSLQSSNATKVIPVKRSWNIMSEVADRVSVGYVPYGRWKECLGRGDLVISLVVDIRISTLILIYLCASIRLHCEQNANAFSRHQPFEECDWN